jgi:hypothetical protein
MHSITGRHFSMGLADPVNRGFRRANGTGPGRRGEDEQLAGQPADFAGLIAVNKVEVKGKNNTMLAEDGQTGNRPAARHDEPGGLLAVLEKLATRSEGRPEVNGLANAAFHIRQNLERHGWAAPAEIVEDETRVSDTGTVDEPAATESVLEVIVDSEAVLDETHESYMLAQEADDTVNA